MDALEVDVATEPEPGSVRAVVELVERAGASLGHPALSEHKRIELGRLAGSPGVTARREGDQVTVGLLAHAAGDSALLGYAQLSGDAGAGRYAVELVVDPGSPRAGAGRDRVADALLDAASGVVAARGGGTLRLWVAKAGDVDDARASEHGFVPERDLIQMRCPLPLPASAGRSGAEAPIETRPFRPGIDEQAWLSTNNRAFSAHPEQGHWTLATLLEREREPWFDPEGLLVLEVQGRVAGSCWTKIHDRTDPPMGEIYVIGVDPDFHGRGWGRALTRAGLDWLAGRGLTVGMLYVDADNRVAVSMYRSMGFEPDHVDRAYVTSVDPI
jgi:mycothiol synthase